jgi:hypothetical protein
MSADSRITRRTLVGIAAAITSSTAQEQPAPATAPAPEQDLNARRSQMKANFEQMSKIALPMSVEPAVHFKA